MIGARLHLMAGTERLEMISDKPFAEQIMLGGMT